jgi:hypothetical protein
MIESKFPILAKVTCRPRSREGHALWGLASDGQSLEARTSRLWRCRGISNIPPDTILSLHTTGLLLDTILQHCSSSHPPFLSLHLLVFHQSIPLLPSIIQQPIETPPPHLNLTFHSNNHPSCLHHASSPFNPIQPQCLVSLTASPEQIRTTTTDLLKIKHPVLLAGMNVAAGPKLAAAVTNAGGLGVIGGVGYTPDMLREQVAELKGYLNDKNAPFGVDLLIPQVGGSARKTK